MCALIGLRVATRTKVTLVIRKDVSSGDNMSFYSHYGVHFVNQSTKVNFFNLGNPLIFFVQILVSNIVA